jgi:GNAT superfamily N-acetyltransferase
MQPSRRPSFGLENPPAGAAPETEFSRYAAHSTGPVRLLAFRPMTTLRPATAADVPLILRFIRELAAYERLLPEVEATEEKLRATLFPAAGRPAAECVLASWDDAPAGFALFFPNYSTFLARPGLYLEDLYVSPACRGRGVGAALFHHCARLANARGCGRMEWSVLDWNEPALGFYRRLGAVALRDWRICRLTGAALARFA